MSYRNIAISGSTLNLWQSLLNLMAAKYIVPAALIMKIDLPDIKVFLSSLSTGNPYEVGDAENLIGSGLYCERVTNTGLKLLVPNALKDPEWDRNPDIKLGMISYIGLPIRFPNGDIFGTICLLDSKENPFNESQSEALNIFREYIECYLDLKASSLLDDNSDEYAEKEMRCDKLLGQVENFLNID